MSVPFAECLGSVGAVDEEKRTLSVVVSRFGHETPLAPPSAQVTPVP